MTTDSKILQQDHPSCRSYKSIAINLKNQQMHSVSQFKQDR